MVVCDRPEVIMTRSAIATEAVVAVSVWEHRAQAVVLNLRSLSLPMASEVGVGTEML